MNCRIGSRPVESRQSVRTPSVDFQHDARTLGAPASPPAAAAGGQETRRPEAGTTLRLGRALLGVLFLAGCSAVDLPGPACRLLDVTELPALGVVRGTWMDDERFVLVDLHRSRLLVYGVDAGLVRMVNGWESENPALSFEGPMDIQPWRRGYVLVVGYGNSRDRLLELDSKLRPVRVLWETDVEEKARGAWSGQELFAITDLAALRDRVYADGTRLDDAGHSELLEWEEEFVELRADSRSAATAGALREAAAWPGFPGELGVHGSNSDVATTGGRGGSAFALRFAPDEPFIQELVGEGRRLKALPDLPAPLPEALRAGGSGWAGWGPVEASSYPAGLYGDESSLYVLMRNATGDAVVWDLHRIDPELDAVVDKLRLPTNAPHVGLLPGRRYWVLQEAGSGLEDPRRPPIRLLLLDAAAIRAGESVSCD